MESDQGVVSVDSRKTNGFSQNPLLDFLRDSERASYKRQRGPKCRLKCHRALTAILMGVAKHSQPNQHIYWLVTGRHQYSMPTSMSSTVH